MTESIEHLAMTVHDMKDVLSGMRAEQQRIVHYIQEMETRLAQLEQLARRLDDHGGMGE
jgi:hypothetical protein